MRPPRLSDFFARSAMAWDEPKPLSLAQEEAATGKANNEVEVVFYARLPAENYGMLSAATLVEHHEQWEIRLPKTASTACSGRMRNRMTIPILPTKGAAEFVQTTKTKQQVGEKEIAIPSSQDGFEQFKMLSDRGMVKRRYVIPIPGYKAVWEVDRYYDIARGDGRPIFHEWVKIDFEKQEGDPEQIPNLPEGFVDIITPWKRTPELEAKVRQLYDQFFLLKNQYVQVAPQQELGTTPEAPAVKALSD